MPEEAQSIRAVAIIPAQGGSKGVVQKNARFLAGSPLVSHTILAALGSGVFDVVAVSTEDSEVANIARRAGCIVVDRPEALAADSALTGPVMAHAVETLETDGFGPFGSVWLLQPTSPLRTAIDIRLAAEILAARGVDSVVSVTPDHSFLWTGRVGEGGCIQPGYDLASRPRRQDRGPVWRENGAIYAVVRKLWDGQGVRAAGRIAGYEMPGDRSLEIDTEADWLMAEATLARLDRSSEVGGLLRSVRAVAFDFDGVMTDNTVHTMQDGAEAVVCSRSDGWGIALLRKRGIPLVVISTEENPVVSARCEKLKMECLQGVDDKRSALLSWLSRQNLGAEACAFVGNDENDLQCLQMAGLAVVPSDAHPSACAVADIVLSYAGGKGAVRELCDMLIGSFDDAELGRRGEPS